VKDILSVCLTGDVYLVLPAHRYSNVLRKGRHYCRPFFI